MGSIAMRTSSRGLSVERVEWVMVEEASVQLISATAAQVWK